MKNILYVIAVVLLVAWGIGFFGFQIGGLLHALLVVALIVLILNIIQGKKIL
ncbi:lmo0937 family membrane protein [Robiginitalea sp. SC105]|uniref:lmo0937 family membrane protein n=1 Tax=Robiginitalea sp. SC105 TaxID=2762332 RepID=UPI00163A3997|nr:lmo0937 family membrane protein [Robiginitalea sp. SC105]MBC2839825.1 lmo0937 family membrane protein [Robiginitalea sp. SC105]